MGVEEQTQESPWFDYRVFEEEALKQLKEGKALEGDLL